jgi:hypothetical protein
MRRGRLVDLPIEKECRECGEVRQLPSCLRSTDAEHTTRLQGR